MRLVVLFSEYKPRLMIRARFKAWCHLMRHIRHPEKHQVWRQYFAWGLVTQRVFCTCGKEFK